MTRQGDNGFTNADAFDLRNSRYGLLVGYHIGRVTVESGATTLPVYTGYRFVVDPGFVVGSATKVTYWQFSLNIQYTIWRPAKQLDLNALAGLAVNTELGESLLSPTYQTIATKTNPDGSQTTTRSTITTLYRKNFLSSSLGVSLTYQLASLFDINVQVNRLFSSKNIVNRSAQLQQSGNSSSYNVTTKAGAGGLSALLSVTYRFKTTN
ncbi:hypothetical protein [Spirosoma radiotolerans]|uniref:Outer membrane protein beta-barrel domain-containing protein n=1 Tax=Spirosoma radiotolerans TaxID=1379870 RepID=A0A0E3ZSU9_9BACT|nr:hypothetical protein [Spirosoma radiotolerans]AKD53700.1 hypothetical protein SD10_01080 [Spirosoma radiotolerans]